MGNYTFIKDHPLKNHESIIEKLPDEMMYTILQYLEIDSILNCCCTNRNLSSFIKKDKEMFWRDIFIREKMKFHPKIRNGQRLRLLESSKFSWKEKVKQLSTEMSLINKYLNKYEFGFLSKQRSLKKEKMNEKNERENKEEEKYIHKVLKNIHICLIAVEATVCCEYFKFLFRSRDEDEYLINFKPVEKSLSNSNGITVAISVDYCMFDPDHVSSDEDNTTSVFCSISNSISESISDNRDETPHRRRRRRNSAYEATKSFDYSTDDIINLYRNVEGSIRNVNMFADDSIKCSAIIFIFDLNEKYSLKILSTVIEKFKSKKSKQKNFFLVGVGRKGEKRDVLIEDVLDFKRKYSQFNLDYFKMTYKNWKEENKRNDIFEEETVSLFNLLEVISRKCMEN